MPEPSLEKKDIFSGVGEMIKVHAIDSPDSFNQISHHYDEIIGQKPLDL